MDRGNHMHGSDINFYNYHPELADLRMEVVEGLTMARRSIAPKFFYDRTGSQLFDAICSTPEYYLTRTEIDIIRKYKGEIVECIGSGCLLIEPGSGNSRKVRELLEALQPHAYMPMDISSSYLRDEAKKLAVEYPWLDVHAVCTDYTSPVELPYRPVGPHRVAFFPGSSIGNFEPDDAIEFLANIASIVTPDGGLLIGVDLKKDEKILNAAYNDAQGYTAKFNLNLLKRINRDLGADFQQQKFSHHAFYNEQKGRVEMHLVSKAYQEIKIDMHRFSFGKGESIHTENSYKYTIEEFHALLKQAGFVPIQVWTDANKLFSVHYFEIGKNVS